MENRHPIRAFTVGGIYLRRLSLKEANRLIFIGLAKVRTATSRNLKSIIELRSRVDHSIPGASLRSVCREQLGDTHSVLVLLRATKDKRLVPWDPRLTGEEARAGRFISAETQRIRNEQQREANAFRRTGRVSFD